jgi:hypothetical protein
MKEEVEASLTLVPLSIKLRSFFAFIRRRNSTVFLTLISPSSILYIPVVVLSAFLVHLSVLT